MTVPHSTTIRKFTVGLALAGLTAALALVTVNHPPHANRDVIGAGEDIAISPAAQTLSAPPLDTAAVTDTFGWLLTPDQMLVSRDSGNTLTDTLAPVPSGSARAAHFYNASDGIVAGASDGVITVARTGDGGATWSTTVVSGAALPPGQGYSQLRLAFATPMRGVMLAQIATSSNFSLGTLFSTNDGGTTWTAHQAPAAGEVSVDPDGRAWLAGGVEGDQLFTSTDSGASWSHPQLNVQPGRQIAGVGLPNAGRLPVTVLNAGATEVEMLSTTDQGATWHPAKSVAIVGHTAMGVREPVAATAGGAVVFDTGGGHAWRIDDGSDLHPAGLPQGLDKVAFAPDGRTGWALAVHGECTNGKQNCTLFREVIRTADGGTSWQRVQVWSERVD